MILINLLICLGLCYGIKAAQHRKKHSLAIFCSGALGWNLHIILLEIVSL